MSTPSSTQFIKEITVESYEEYIKTALEIMGSGEENFLFRGQSDSTWDVRSGLSRYLNQFQSEEKKKQVINNAQNAFMSFKVQRHAYNSLNSANNWEILTLAQHYGLRTPLLDWSRAPNVALYFALYGAKYNKEGGIASEDAAVYLFPFSNEIKINTVEHMDKISCNPYDADKFKNTNDPFILQPNAINERVKLQEGIFTFSPQLDYVFPNGQLYKITIPKEKIAKILFATYNLRINSTSLFGSLEGLCKDLNFEYF